MTGHNSIQNGQELFKTPIKEEKLMDKDGHGDMLGEGCSDEAPIELQNELQKDMSVTAIEECEENIREDMVQIAKRFINSLQVKNRSRNMIQDFLLSKGLSKLEIEKAFKLSEDSTNPVKALSSTASRRIAEVKLGSGSLFSGICRVLARLKDFFSIAFFALGSFYGLQFLYKHYLEPWLTGQDRKESVELELVRQHKVLADNLARLQSTVETLGRSVASCMDAVQKAQPKNLLAFAQSVDQIEKDLSSIRSMVLNRGNFTAPPPVAFKIPEWQKKSGSILNGISSSNDVYTTSVVSTPNVVLENSTVSIDSTVSQSPLQLELKAIDTISPVSQSDISDCSAEVTCAASCNSSPLIVTENETQITKTCSSVPSCENSIVLPDIENSLLPGLLTSADESSDGS